MFKYTLNKIILISCIVIGFSACKLPSTAQKSVDQKVPEMYNHSKDTINSATENWRTFFNDAYLVALIDTALKNNQELNIILQEIEISKYEIRSRKGEYLPFLGLVGGAAVDKAGRYTSKGANDATTDIKEGVETPEPLPDYLLAAKASWEIDIWKKLRNGKKSAVTRYLSTVEGKNFMITNLVAEVAYSYYELLALDNQLEFIQQNIKIQSDALRIVKLQKSSAMVTELAVQRFEAQVYHTKSLQYEIQQKIVETENRINFLVGRFPQKVERNAQNFSSLVPQQITAGVPAQLLENRADIKQAELELTASKLDVKIAKANFYPSLDISATLGFQAFKPSFLLQTPESMLYTLAGELTAPLINRNAIKSVYYSANAKQIQAVYNYQKTVLNAYISVANQLSNIEKLANNYEMKNKEVEALTQSITIANSLFQSARADYMEVLLTQRDALESKMDLIDTKKEQMLATIHVYQALGGGWK